MKTLQAYWIVLFFAMALFTSCDPSTIEADSNYWSSNTLTREHLNGKVKSITTDNGANIVEYNQDGYITRKVNSSSGNVSTSTYNYKATGELESEAFTSTNGDTPISYSTTYVYEKTNKYVVTNPFHLLMDGLIPNLKSISSKWQQTDFQLNGNTILAISTYESSKDTTVIEYNGNYPSVVSRGDYSIRNFVYASNGMFKSYTASNQSLNYSSEEKYYFKSDDKFLLLDSIVDTRTNNNIQSKSKQKYSYDSNRNIIRLESWGTIYEYSYVYDSQQNWTSKTTRTQTEGTSTWSTPTTETRTITYW